MCDRDNKVTIIIDLEACGVVPVDVYIILQYYRRFISVLKILFFIFSASGTQNTLCVARQLTAMSLLYAAVNFAGMYTKYLTDRSQRKAFLETHRSTEARFKTQKENEQQEKLLLSGTLTTRYIVKHKSVVVCH